MGQGVICQEHVRSGEPGSGGGESGGVLLPVLLAPPFRAAARVFRGGDGGRGGGALAVQFPGGAAGEFFGLLACPGLGFHLGDGLGGGGAGLGGAKLGGVPGRCAADGLGASLFQLGCGLGADCLGLGFGGLGVTGRGELPAEDSELVQRGGQLRAEPGLVAGQSPAGQPGHGPAVPFGSCAVRCGAADHGFVGNADVHRGAQDCPSLAVGWADIPGIVPVCLALSTGLAAVLQIFNSRCPSSLAPCSARFR